MAQGAEFVYILWSSFNWNRAKQVFCILFSMFVVFLRISFFICEGYGFILDGAK